MSVAPKHVVIFSHGFGVKRDDRGLLDGPQGIAPALRAVGIETVLFDYNDIDQVNNTLTVYPLSVQAEKLREVVERVQRDNPDAVVDILAHSQGCLVVALANVDGIRKSVFLAPSLVTDIEKMVQAFSGRPGTEIDFEGVSKLARLDGTLTLVPKQFWTERASMEPISLYNVYSEQSEIFMINARQDDILKRGDVSLLDSSVTIEELDGDHNFHGGARAPLIEKIKAILL